MVTLHDLRVTSHHMLFTAMCPSGGTKYISFGLLLDILRGPGEGRGCPWTKYGTFAKPKGHF